MQGFQGVDAAPARRHLRVDSPPPAAGHCRARRPRGSPHAIQGLLRDPRRAARRVRRRDQEGFPAARAQVPPGRLQGARRRGAHEGGQRGQRGALRRRAPRGLRPVARAWRTRRTGFRAAAGLGRGLRVLRARLPGRRERRLQRLLRRAVRPHGWRGGRTRRGLRRAPPRGPGTRPGPSRQDPARHRGRVRRRPPPAEPARARARPAGTGRAEDPHARRADPQGRARRPVDPPRGPGHAGARRRAARRPVPRGALRAAPALRGARSRPRAWSCRSRRGKPRSAPSCR